MALVLGATITSEVLDNGTVLTFSHTVDSGSNLLVVAESHNSNADPTSVTFNGVALTKAVFVGNSNEPNRATIWYLVNPTVTTANIVVTIGANRGIVAGAYNFSGASTSPIGNTATQNNGNSTSSSSSLSITAAESGNYIIDVVSVTAQDPTVGADQTQRWNKTSGPTNNHRGASSTETGSSGSHTMSWTFGTANACQASVEILGASVNPNVNDTVTVTESSPVDIISRHIQPGEIKGIKIIG